MKRVIVQVGGMSCHHCERAVQQALQELEGVISVQVELANARAIIEYDEAVFKITDIEPAITEQGYDFLGLSD